MRALDLESDPVLLELLGARLRDLEYEAAAIARHAAAIGSAEVADWLGQLVCDINCIKAIPEVLASRL